MARYHGKNGRVYLATTGTAAAASIGNVSDWGFNGTKDMVETTSMGDSNKAYVSGLRDVKGTLAGFWDSAVDTLFTAAECDDPVMMYIYPTDADTKYWYGYVNVDVSVSSGVNAAIKTSSTFTCSGTWGRI